MSKKNFCVQTRSGFACKLSPKKRHMCSHHERIQIFDDLYLDEIGGCRHASNYSNVCESEKAIAEARKGNSDE